ncbi:MAG: HAMP domain-containing protein [bacterium]|nr:HAMP domain-containing protein [bacterium]
MSLRGKFHLLLALLGISIAANMAVAVWCTRIYVDTATDRFHEFVSDVRRTELIRRLLDDLVIELQTRAKRIKPLNDDRYRVMCRRIVEEVSGLPSAVDDRQGEGTDTKTGLLELSRQLSDRSGQHMSLLADGRNEEAAAILATAIERECVSPMRKRLGEVALRNDTSIAQIAAVVAEQQNWVTGVLAVNAVVVFLVLAVSFHLVRYWMLKPVGAIKTATERHAAGDLSYRIPEHSNDELGVLSRQVNSMADSLATVQRRLVEQERLAAVGELASSVAHNIRNPLANIRISVQSYMKRAPQGDENLAHLTTVIEAVDSLNQWLHDLLTVHKSIDLERRTVVARGLVDRVVKVVRSDAERRGIRIEVEESPTGCMVHVDSSRLGQAVLAVVSNAVEASPENGVVRVTICRSAEMPEQVDIQVTDSGSGIPPGIRDRLASPFSTTKPGGTGIGLYLAKRVATAHGGEIGFRDNPGGGTIVTLSLPSNPAETVGEPTGR